MYATHCFISKEKLCSTMHTRQWLCKNILWKASHVEQSMFLKTCHISVKVTLFLSHTRDWRDFHFLRQSFSVIASLIPAYAFNNNTILDCYIFFAWNHMVKFYLLIIFVCVPVKPFFSWLCYWLVGCIAVLLELLL